MQSGTDDKYLAPGCGAPINMTPSRGVVTGFNGGDASFQVGFLVVHDVLAHLIGGYSVNYIVSGEGELVHGKPGTDTAIWHSEASVVEGSAPFVSVDGYGLAESFPEPVVKHRHNGINVPPRINATLRGKIHDCLRNKLLDCEVPRAVNICCFAFGNWSEYIGKHDVY